MAKELARVGLGADGGYAAAVAEGGMLKLELGYPLSKLLAPLKAKVVDKLKELIPGNFEDSFLDKGWDELVKSLEE